MEEGTLEGIKETLRGCEDENVKKLAEEIFEIRRDGDRGEE